MKKVLASALTAILTPIVKIVLRNGMTHKEFSQLSKEVFIKTTASDFGINGRETNTSRISIITGIDRKEVKRIKDILSEDNLLESSQYSQNRLTRILTAWHQDREFLDANNNPKQLPIHGDTGSFSSLVKRFGGNVPIVAILKELLRGQAIEEIEKGVSIRILKRNFFPDKSDPEALLRMASVMNDIGLVLFNNVYADKNEKNKAPSHLKSSNGLLFERRATNNDIPIELINEYKELLDIEGQYFLERIDAWLTSREQLDENNPTEKIRLGVGMYQIQSNIPSLKQKK